MGRLVYLLQRNPKTDYEQELILDMLDIIDK